MNTWHATDETLVDYRHGATDPTLSASLEAHLLACDPCRRRLAHAGGPVGATDTARRWELLAERLDAPGTSALSRISLSTRPLLSAWLVAAVLVVLLPLLPVLAVGAHVPTLLLGMAPLAPIVAVALAYRTSADPAGELALATPMAGLRTIAGRALVVSAALVPLGVLAPLLLGFPAHVAAAWLLPGLALSSLVLLAGTTRLDPTVVAGVLAVGWPLAVALPTAVRRVRPDLVADVIAAPPSQLAMGAVAAAALLVAVARRDHVTYRRIR